MEPASRQRLLYGSEITQNQAKMPLKSGFSDGLGGAFFKQALRPSPLILLLGLLFVSCEKEQMADSTPMYQMYTESVNLPQATLDSITNFTHKFGGYVGSHPDSRQDQYFAPTLQNLRNAAALHGYTIKETTVTTGITVNDEWAGETYIYY